MRIEASTIEELFEKSESHEELIRTIDKIIRETAPDLKRQLFPGDSITMVGYGEIKTSDDDVWPLISLAPQKQTVNLYIAVEKEGVPLPQYYADYFGKTAVGKNCIRIRSVQTLKPEILKELVRETLLWSDLKNNKYGRHSTVSR